MSPGEDGAVVLPVACLTGHGEFRGWGGVVEDLVGAVFAGGCEVGDFDSCSSARFGYRRRVPLPIAIDAGNELHFGGLKAIANTFSLRR